MKNKFANLYCPLCLGELDDTGSCWPVCNYEQDNALPEYKALTKLKRTKILYANAEINLKLAKREMSRLKKLMNQLEPKRSKKRDYDEPNMGDLIGSMTRGTTR